MNIGILHPGEMGASLGAALVSAGHTVFWSKAGRSVASAGRAGDDGLRAVESLGELVRTVSVIVSICPPANALEQARAVAGAGFDGLYVDANAVSPETVQMIASTLAGVAEFVDGGVIGPPARRAGTTRLYLSGPRAKDIAALFDGSLVEACAIDGGPGAASTLKMCYAAWTKGSAALLMAVAALARRERLGDVLAREWGLSQPGLAEKLQGTALSTAPKAWRFSDEMAEIATTFREADMPDGFHLAAADIFGRLSGLKNETVTDSETILELLARQ